MSGGRVQRSQQGAVLLIMLAILGLGSAWFLVSALNAETGGIEAQRKKHNAEVLRRAKQMVIGQVALQAAKADETNPGRLACPEPAGSAGGVLEGSTAGNCALPAVGRFPWRTFGTEKLVDAFGEPLWYVVSPGWALSTATTPTYINSSSMGQLLINARLVSTISQSAGVATVVSVNHGFRTGDVVKISGAMPAGFSVAAPVIVVDADRFTYPVNAALPANATGAAIKAGDAVVALIIAPGAAVNVAASAGCTARNQPQWRREPAPTINALDYLECFDAANGVFSTSAPVGSSFNDQVLPITAAELLPAIEAAIAGRIERQIAPVLSDAFLGSNWGLGGRERMFPFAAAFADPGLGTTTFHGAPPLAQGLLPFNFGEACDPATEARCLPMAFWPATPPVAYQNGGFGFIRGASQTCNWDPTDTTAALCEGEYQEDGSNPSGAGMYIELTATIRNVANGWRSLETRVEARDDVLLGPWQVMPPNITTTMNADGSATIRFGANLPNIDAMGWGTYAKYRIRLKVADHPLLSTRPRQISFDSGSTSEIRVGQTLVGATSGASGRVSGVSVTGGNWETGPGAAGTIRFHSVTGTFLNNETLRVLGVTRARATSAESDADTTVSWFARNEWYRDVYYSVAAGYAWTGSGTCSHTPPVSCLQVAYLPVAADQPKQRALLVLMGQRVGAQARPSSSLADHLDSEENSDLDGLFEQLAVGRTSNDRFITISKNP